MDTNIIKQSGSEIAEIKIFNRIFRTLLGIVLLSFVLFNTTGCGQKDPDITQEPNAANELSQTDSEKENIKIGDDGVNAGIAADREDDVAAVAKQKTEDELKPTVSISVEDIGRSDPFLPEHERLMASSATNNVKAKQRPSYDLLPPPPEMITSDETATEVIATKVSGILYDRMNPSAILNINNSDFLVRTGDIINDYKVLSIEKEYVTVQHGANVYKAGVGELFTGNGINYNTISNLDNKFGGGKNLK